MDRSLNFLPTTARHTTAAAARPTTARSIRLRVLGLCRSVQSLGARVLFRSGLAFFVVRAVVRQACSLAGHVRYASHYIHDCDFSIPYKSIQVSHMESLLPLLNQLFEIQDAYKDGTHHHSKCQHRVG